jgi:hypothetical protein
VGKSHIAQAIGHRACRAGHAVLYVEASDMLKQLRAARADGSYDRRLLRFTTPALLVIDDLGLRSLIGDEPVDLYEIIRQRYQRGATLITTNRDADEIPTLFGDPLLASAANGSPAAQRSRPRIRGGVLSKPATQPSTCRPQFVPQGDIVNALTNALADHFGVPNVSPRSPRTAPPRSVRMIPPRSA